MTHPLVAVGRYFGWRWCLLLVTLLSLWVGAALAVVWSAHQARQLFAELHAQQRQYDLLLERRAQLLVERSTVADLARIEQVAVADLGMVLPEIVAPDVTVEGRP